jgi:2,4-dienoyl-CoA reductase (NADPH2)
MEAAVVAASKGHKVTLCERRPRLGGALLAGSILRQELEDLTKYFVAQTRDLPIRVELSTEVTPELIADLKPDTVIVATGGTPMTPKLPGVEDGKVFGIEDVYRVMGDSAGTTRGVRRKLLLWVGSVFVRYFYRPSLMRQCARLVFGKKVVVVGGGMAGVELGAFLADMGKKVTIVEASERAGKGLTPVVRRYWIDKVRNGGGVILTGVKWERIDPKGLVITRGDGNREILMGDMVILALGARTNTKLLEILQGKVPEVYPIGDCVDPQTVLEAVRDGFRIGRDL